MKPYLTELSCRAAEHHQGLNSAPETKKKEINALKKRVIHVHSAHRPPTQWPQQTALIERRRFNEVSEAPLRAGESSALNSIKISNE